MRIVNKPWLVIGCLACAGLIATLFYYRSEKAPEQRFTTITGQSFQLSELLGKPVIVTFWATDCPACIHEIPEFEAVYRNYHRQGLEIIAVAMYYDPPSHVVAMSAAKQLPYRVALDTAAEHARAFGGVALIPTTFLISPEGLLAKRYTGSINRQQLIDDINSLVKG